MDSEYNLAGSLNKGEMMNMALHDDNLIWIDLEMTGLDTRTDEILEIATVVTDSWLHILAEGPVCVIKHTQARLDAMDHWNKTQHGQSGLIDRVLASTTTLQQAEEVTLAFLRQYVPAGKSPMCGNSICQDRRFLARWMPQLESYFHYRHIDVSTVKELALRWCPALAHGFIKNSRHLALDDIRDSIAELSYYQKNFFNLLS